MTFIVVAGTRPEAIKLRPVVRELRILNLPVTVLGTGQHTDLLADTGLVFDEHLPPLLDDPTRDPIALGTGIRQAVASWLSKHATTRQNVQDNVVVVVGDTASAWGAALGAYDSGIPVAHVEAGVRSGDLANPWPEEIFRREIDRIAQWCFCPTQQNKDNLDALQVGWSDDYYRPNTYVTGNPGIDSLYENVTPTPYREARVLVTLHRRESWGDPMRAIVHGLRSVATARAWTIFDVFTHPNGQVEQAVGEFTNPSNLHLCPPESPARFQQTLSTSLLVLTDSGGVQEEAAALGVPCVVARDTTDRPESVQSGHAIVAGRTTAGIAEALTAALRGTLKTDPSHCFGDGKSAPRIAQIIANSIP